MYKILVTGGLGYIGYSLINEIVKKNTYSEIIIYDNLYRKNIDILLGKNLKGKKISFVEGDILDDRTLNDAFEDVDCVIHLAAKVTTPFAQGDFHMFDYVNNWGTSNVVNAALKHNVKEFIYLSTLSVYGNSNDLINSDSPLSPDSDYGRSKYLGEQHLQILPDSCKKIIIRSGNTYGANPSLRLDTVVNNFVFKARFGQKIVIHGNGNQSTAFIQIERLANQVASLMLNEKIEAGTYLLSDFCCSVNELIKIIKKINPKTEYTYINPERTMGSQVIKEQVLKGFPVLEQKQFEQDIENFYHSFL